MIPILMYNLFLPQFKLLIVDRLLIYFFKCNFAFNYHYQGNLYYIISYSILKT